jgi:hypothetical protein
MIIAQVTLDPTPQPLLSLRRGSVFSTDDRGLDLWVVVEPDRVYPSAVSLRTGGLLQFGAGRLVMLCTSCTMGVE